MRFARYATGLAYGEPPPAARVCDNRRIPAATAITPATAARISCTSATAFGVADPVAVVTRAVARSIEMLDNTIAELVRARTAVCAGAPPAWPLIGDVTADWLRNRLSVCIDDIRVWTAGTFVNRSIAEVIRRLTRVRNLIASNGIRYVCNPGPCNVGETPCPPGRWAFVCISVGTCSTVPAIIRLCRNFWIAQAGVSAADHAEFQAQTILHEASHLYYCTADTTGSTIGVAECLSQFVAATNGSPIDPTFAARCAVTTRCGVAAAGPGAPRAAQVAGVGFGGLGLVRIVSTSFNPRNAIRPRGRPAARSGR
jgi:hypothetical protein